MKSALFCLTLLVLLTGCRPDRPPVAMDEPRQHPGWKSDFITSNGIRLHYWRTGGEGKPVLILAHGITDYGLNYGALAEKFENDYDIIMYDARGHGWSDKPDGPYDLATHVKDLVGLIQALHLEKPVLMGHSMGGSTVALLAATYPDLPRAIILEDPADMNEPEQGLTPEVIPQWKQQMESMKNQPPDSNIAAVQKYFTHKWSDSTYALWAESKTLVNVNVADILNGDGFGDAEKTFPNITVPTLILKADADSTHRQRHLRIAGLLPEGKLVHVANAQHVIRNDQPAEVERLMRAFLAGLGQKTDQTQTKAP